VKQTYPQPNASPATINACRRAFAAMKAAQERDPKAVSWEEVMEVLKNEV